MNRPSLRLRGAGLLALLLCIGRASAIETCDLDGQSVNLNNGSTTAGRSGLVRCRDRDSGAVTREQELRDGRLMGVVRYFKRGVVEREYTVDEHGNRDGPAREWLVGDDGRRVLIHEETDRNGRAQGVARSWYPSGTLRRLTFYGDEEREQASADFTDSGRLNRLRCATMPVFGKDFDDRTACGHDGRVSSVTLFDAKDRPTARIAFERGETRRSEVLWDSGAVREVRETTAAGGVERSFAADGTKRHEVQWVTVASPTGRPRRVDTLDQEFHDSGKLIRERRWAPSDRGADPVSQTSWYLNGQIREETRYVASGDRQVRRETAFHDNGARSFEGTWVVGAAVDTAPRGRGEFPTGVHRTFDERGRLRSEQTYDDRGRLTHERELDEQGVVSRDDEVFEDGSRKSVGR